MEPPDPDFTLRGFDSPVTCLTFMNNDTDHLLAGTQNGTLYCWDLRRRRIVYNQPFIHSSSMLSMAFVEGQQELLTQGREGIIHRWSFEGHEVASKLESYPSGEIGFCPAAVFNIDHRAVLAATTSKLSVIAIIDVDSGSMVTTLEPQEQVGMAMNVKAADGYLLIAGYEDGSVGMWDVRKPDGFVVRVKLHDEPIASLDYSNKMQRGLSGDVYGAIVMWDGVTLARMASANVEQGVACIRVRQDGKLFAVGCCNSCINLYSVHRKMTQLVSACTHSKSVESLAFNSKDCRLAAGSQDKTVSIWSIYTDN